MSIEVTTVRVVEVTDSETGKVLNEYQLDSMFREATNRVYTKLEFGEFEMDAAEALFRLDKTEYKRQKINWIFSMEDSGYFLIKNV